MSTMSTAAVGDYIDRHGLERALSYSVNLTISKRSDEPLLFLSQTLQTLSDSRINILITDDEKCRGDAQQWLVSVGAAMQQAGHQVTFLLPSESLILPDCKGVSGALVDTYDHEKIADSKAAMYGHKRLFKHLLQPAHICLANLSPKRGFDASFENVEFLSEVIEDEELKTMLIVRSNARAANHRPSFYGGKLLESKQCHVVPANAHLEKFVTGPMAVPAALVRRLYSGVDTAWLTSRTPEIVAEAHHRYPLVAPGVRGSAFVVGCMAPLEEWNGQKLLLEAAKRVVQGGRLPHFHVLLVGSGPERPALLSAISDMGLGSHVSIVPFTREPHYVFGRCSAIAVPSVDEREELLPRVLLDALAMETPCIAPSDTAATELVVDGLTGSVFTDGDAGSLAESLVSMAAADLRAMGSAGKQLVLTKHDRQKQIAEMVAFLGDRAAAVKQMQAA